jgi:hypothetical protein
MSPVEVLLVEHRSRRRGRRRRGIIGRRRGRRIVRRLRIIRRIARICRIFRKVMEVFIESGDQVFQTSAAAEGEE